MDISTRFGSIPIRGIVLGFIIALACLMVFVLFRQVHSKQADSKGLEAEYRELKAMREKVLLTKRELDRLDRKKGLIKVDGIVAAIDNVVTPLGLKSRLKALKPVQQRKAGTVRGEEATLTMEHLTMNETVNFFYKIQSAPYPLSVKHAGIKKNFERPDLLDLTCSLFLFQS
ncbi:MAG: hypothetical protein V1736_04115 [Pseudomonadota bacterium]